MKLKNYIAPFLLSLLLLVVVVDVSAQAPTKTQSIATASKALEFTAYVSGQDLRIDFEIAPTIDYTIELYNLTGAKVGEWRVQKNVDKYCELSLKEPLRKGLYIIKVSAGQHTMAKKAQA